MSLRNLQRRIHAGCRELGIDADDRRQLQLITTGKASMSEMDEAELGAVIDALKARGLKGRTKRPPAQRADVRFAHVLWRLLYEAGEARQKGAAGLNAFIRARFGHHWGAVPIDIDQMQDSKKIADVIDALKSWCGRAGIDVRR